MQEIWNPIWKEVKGIPRVMVKGHPRMKGGYQWKWQPVQTGVGQKALEISSG